MADDREPDRNIGGGDAGGGDRIEIDESDAGSRVEAVVDRLGELYWRKAYGGQDAFACLVRTILSQNTSDAASQPAFDALRDRYAEGDTGFAAAVAAADQTTIAEIIQPAGLHNQKATVLQGVADRVVTEFGGEAAFDAFVREEDRETVRERLLAFDGVGPKTADCVLLFAGGQPGVFPVDTHVHRIYRRMGIGPPTADHEAVRTVLESAVPPEKCGFGHTASIEFGREYCTARRPACVDGEDACPLEDLCDQVGVDPDDGTVVDPAEIQDR